MTRACSPKRPAICCGSRTASSTATGFSHCWRPAARAGDPTLAGARLREAESLWRGRALADVDLGGGARAELARLEELRLCAVEARIDAELALGGHDVLVGELDALAREHPLREHLRGQLMLALYRAGRQEEALAVFRDARAPGSWRSSGSSLARACGSWRAGSCATTRR